MAIEVRKGHQQTPMGRKLFSMAAPLVGGAIGGPAGAAVGGILGSKIGGASTSDSLASGLQAGISQGVSGGAGADAATPADAAIVGRGAGGAQNAFGRKLEMSKLDPANAPAQGLSLLNSFAPDDPLRQELGPSFIRADMMNKRRGF